MAYMGKFPVVFISLKGLDGLTFEDACSMLGEIIQKSLALLTELLYKHYGQKAILLIDEYDVPLDKAFVHGYNEEMVALLRGLFGQALKTNDYLQFAVLTGCLRVSKGASLRD